MGGGRSLPPPAEARPGRSRTGERKPDGGRARRAGGCARGPPPLLRAVGGRGGRGEWASTCCARGPGWGRSLLSGRVPAARVCVGAGVPSAPTSPPLQPPLWVCGGQQSRAPPPPLQPPLLVCGGAEVSSAPTPLSAAPPSVWGWQGSRATPDRLPCVRPSRCVWGAEVPGGGAPGPRCALKVVGPSEPALSAGPEPRARVPVGVSFSRLSYVDLRG